MRSLALAAILVLVAPMTALAQDAPDRRFLPYTFAAPGGVSDGGSSLHVGGGLDALVWNGLGVSFEGGYLGPFPDGFGYGIGLVSVNGVYHLAPPRRRQLTTFVTGGYSLGFRSDYGHAVNVGVGANYWLTDKTAMRVEFRDHMPIVEDSDTSHLWGVRVGFTWAR